MDNNTKVHLAVIITVVLLMVSTAVVFYITDAEVASLGKENQDLWRQEKWARERLESCVVDLTNASHGLASCHSDMHSLKVNLTSRLKEVFTLTEQVFNLTGENQRLQDDIVTWKRQSSSTSEQLLEAKALQEQLQQQNKEYQQKINELEFQMANQQPRTNGGSPRAADLCGWEVLIALFLLHLL